MTAEELGLVLARIEVRRRELEVEYLEWYEATQEGLAEDGAASAASLRRTRLDLELGRLTLEGTRAKLKFLESSTLPSRRDGGVR